MYHDCPSPRRRSLPSSNLEEPLDASYQVVRLVNAFLVLQPGAIALIHGIGSGLEFAAENRMNSFDDGEARIEEKCKKA